MSCSQGKSSQNSVTPGTWLTVDANHPLLMEGARTSCLPRGPHCMFPWALDPWGHAIPPLCPLKGQGSVGPGDTGREDWGVYTRAQRRVRPAPPWLQGGSRWGECGQNGNCEVQENLCTF